MSTIEHVISLEEYLNIIKNKPVVIKFGASWCGPCRKLQPIFQKLAEEHGDKIQFCEVNIDKSEDISIHEKIQSIPLVLFYNTDPIPELSVLGFQPNLLAENVDKFAELLTSNS